MPRLRTALAARQDIRDIKRYSRDAFGAKVVAEYLGGLRAAFDLLEKRPLAGMTEPGLGAGLRSFGYRSHRIYYCLEEDGLLVVRILHHAQDVSGAFGSGQ